MTISAMGRTSVVLGLAVCLFLSSFHEVSCQVEAGLDLSKMDTSTESGEYQAATNVDFTQSEAVSGQEELGQSSSMDDIERELDAYFGDVNKQDGSEADGLSKFGESKDATGIDAERRQQLEEIEQKLKAAAATKIVVEEGTTKRKSQVETEEMTFEGVSSASVESSHQSSSYNGWKTGNSGSGTGMLGSLGISQSSGAWRCFNQDRNGVNEEGDASIVIPKYDIDAIIKEESASQGSKSKTSSLIRSLTDIVEKFKKEKWSSGVSVTTGASSSTETSKTVEKLKVTLKKYRSISARELVARSDFEEILATAARYEELSSASVSYISRLSMYRSLIQEGIKASQRVQLAQARARLLKEMAAEKKKNVEAELALVKALAERGDMLYVKIFAIKKLVLKLEAEKEEVDMNFQKTVVSLSRVIEESSKAYEEYHVVVRKWKEEQAAEEFSREAIQSAEEVWVKFLGTL